MHIQGFSHILLNSIFVFSNFIVEVLTDRVVFKILPLTLEGKRILI